MTKQQTVILVDDNDVKIGYEEKEKCHTIHAGKLGYHHRGLTVLIYNSRGEVLLQHRKHRLFDGVWDFAGSTHPLVLDGTEESYEDAARRCLVNEWVGLENVELRIASLFINYSARDPSNDAYCENEFCKLVIGLCDRPIQHRPESAYGHKWMLFADLIVDSGSNTAKYAPWVARFVKKIGEKRTGELSFLRSS